MIEYVEGEYCSFCGVKGCGAEGGSRTLVRGSNVSICEACVNACKSIFERRNGPIPDIHVPFGGDIPLDRAKESK